MNKELPIGDLLCLISTRRFPRVLSESDKDRLGSNWGGRLGALRVELMRDPEEGASARAAQDVKESCGQGRNAEGHKRTVQTISRR